MVADVYSGMRHFSNEQLDEMVSQQTTLWIDKGMDSSQLRKIQSVFYETLPMYASHEPDQDNKYHGTLTLVMAKDRLETGPISRCNITAENVYGLHDLCTTPPVVKYVGGDHYTMLQQSTADIAVFLEDLFSEFNKYTETYIP